MEENPGSPSELSSSFLNKENLLYQLLKKEHGYYQAILEIAHKENATLKTQQAMTDLKPLLKQKKILLACISEIDTAMTPLKKYWQSKTNRNDEASEKIKLELNAINLLLKEILRLDLLSQKTMENHLLYLRERSGALSHVDTNSNPPSMHG